MPGCAIARSQEAKDLGIRMGLPYFEFAHLAKKYNIRIYSSNYSLYGDMSERVMRTLEMHVKDVEVYSIDEAFFDLSFLPEKEVEGFIKKLQIIVKQWTGMIFLQ